jgi:hypothetical protein
MIDHEKILEAINSRDPIIKQTAVDQAKTCGVADKRLLLDLAKKKGGLQELFQAITGIKEVNPDTSKIKLPTMIRRKVATIEISESLPTKENPESEYGICIGDCARHPGLPGIVRKDQSAWVCAGCAAELFAVWKSKPNVSLKTRKELAGSNQGGSGSGPGHKANSAQGPGLASK